MSLKKKLSDILPEILPADSGESVKGTELLARVKEKLGAESGYADNSIRQTFSILAGESGSPIARVDRGHGYYLRPDHEASLQEEVVDEPDSNQRPAFGGAEGSLGSETSSSGRDFQPEEKFRAFYERYSQLEGSFPLAIEHTAGVRQTAGVNRWKFPDVVVVDWDSGTLADDGFSLDPAVLEVQRSLGEQPFRLSSVELKVELSLSTFRENFFQCVSNSMWAHSSQLVVAAPVTDALLARELRRLGASYKVAVQSFGLDTESFHNFPSAGEIREMDDGQFETLAQDVSPQKIAPGQLRNYLDWEHLRDMISQSPEFSRLFEWIERCLRDRRAYNYRRFSELQAIENAPG